MFYTILSNPNPNFSLHLILIYLMSIFINRITEKIKTQKKNNFYVNCIFINIFDISQLFDSLKVGLLASSYNTANISFLKLYDQPESIFGIIHLKKDFIQSGFFCHVA